MTSLNRARLYRPLNVDILRNVPRYLFFRQSEAEGKESAMKRGVPLKQIHHIRSGKMYGIAKKSSEAIG